MSCEAGTCSGPPPRPPSAHVEFEYSVTDDSAQVTPEGDPHAQLPVAQARVSLAFW